MITIQSKINPEYSVTIYSHSKYGKGNGYYFHNSDNVGISPLELKEAGQGAVVKELKPVAEKLWLA